MTVIDTPKKVWTIEAFEALPDDGIERFLIDGELFEGDMTTRNFPHSRSVMKIGYVLLRWLDANPQLGGAVIGGEAAVRLSPTRRTLVGVDGAYLDAELAARTPRDAKRVEGVPVLVIEVLSPSDTTRGINAKIRAYLTEGVKLVWIIDPDPRIVAVHRPDALPQSFNVSHRLEGFGCLPGFSCAVDELF